MLPAKPNTATICEWEETSNADAARESRGCCLRPQLELAICGCKDAIWGDQKNCLPRALDLYDGALPHIT